MTPKEKAEELVDKFYPMFTNSVRDTLAKQCALIAVNEILNIGCIEVPYWLEVKQEIEKFK